MAFRVPTHVTIANGCLAQLPAVARSFGDGPVLLTLDPGLAATPWPGVVTEGLEGGGLAVTTFDRIEANPRAASIELLAEAASQAGAGLIVGLGGGSVLDAAKAAAMLVRNPGRCEDYEGRNRFRAPALPFVAIPTTCGTGSEVTWVSVISVPERRAKISVKGDGMFPRAALVDPDLLKTLPSNLVAWTGVDALTHALEAVTCTLANPASDALATRAVELLCGNLRRAVGDIAGDGAAREAVMTASTLAGLAFGNADVAAVHCLSETLGGLYDVPHGLANALLLVPVLRAHGGAVERPLAALERAVTGQEKGGSAGARAGRVLDALDTLVHDLHIPGFASLGVPAEDFGEIARRAVANGSNSSNPRAMAEDEYLEILADLGGGATGAVARQAVRGGPAATTTHGGCRSLGDRRGGSRG